MLVHINIGSNQNKQQNIKLAIKLLTKYFGKLEVSKIYNTPAIGFSGNDFYNVGVNIDSDLTAQEIIDILSNIENSMGRKRTKSKFTDRVIDLDLIFYGDKIIRELNIPREDIIKYDFTLKPFMEIMNRRKK